MISIYLSQLLKTNKIIVKGSGERFRDFVYIDDLVNIFCNSIKNKKTFNEIINLGTGKKSTVNDVLKNIKKVFNKKLKIEFKNNTPGDQLGIYSDNKKFKRIFKNYKFINLETGIRMSFDSIMKSEGYNPLKFLEEAQSRNIDLTEFY